MMPMPYGPSPLQRQQQAQAAIGAQQASYVAAMQNQTGVGLYQGLGQTTIFNIPISTTTAVSTNSVFVSTIASTSSNTTTLYMNPQTTAGLANIQVGQCIPDTYPHFDLRNLVVVDGNEANITLPDGTVVRVKKDGSHTIEDKDAKVIYRANRVREFNPFINVSDRLEEFIAFCGDQGVRRGEMLEIPIKLFIAWIALEAARADQEPEPDIKLLPDLRRRALPRCPSCQRFVSAAKRAARIEFCAPRCFERHYARAMRT